MSFKLTFSFLAVGSKSQIFSTKYWLTYCEQRTKVMESSASGSRVPNSSVYIIPFIYTSKQAKAVYGVRSQDSGYPRVSVRVCVCVRSW